MTEITDHEIEQVQRANANGSNPVVFIHGLWLLPNSWDRWVTLFEDAGYVALSPGWPDDPETVLGVSGCHQLPASRGGVGASKNR